MPSILQSASGRASATVIGVYVAVAWTVGNLFPFSTFSMYARARWNSLVERTVVVDETGRAYAASDFVVNDCPDRSEWHECAAIPGTAAGIPYIEQRLVQRLAEHRADAVGEPSEPIRIVRRTWDLANGGALVEECEVARCRGRR
ncbi:MAG: hypothetical protein H6700_08875 [Myxococcales bacterium]|nr:hypothetical protein [Myxococcales bacterium]MCB9521116.1 hypothetical protein [Myxococcales bacterium]MCB9531864.1 hypothetical protein [Myxococcales bacterium]